MILLNLDERPEVFKTSFAEFVFVVLIMMAQFLVQATTAMALSTLDIISASFEHQTGQVLTYSQQIWFPSSVALTCGTFILVSGRLGDLFGLKHMVMAGWIWMSIWTLINGLLYYSASVPFFIVCRAFSGIGFALSVPSGMGILGRVYPNGPRKHLVFGLLGACGPTGATGGVLLGAICAKYIWWPWYFWIVSITALIFCILSYYFLPDVNNCKTWEDFKFACSQFDFLGSAVGVIALILLIFSLAQAPAAGWDSAYIIVCLVISIALIALFFWLEVKYVAHPFIPRNIYNMKLLLVLLIMTFGWGSFGVWQYIYWRLVIHLRGYNPVLAALGYGPFIFFGIIAALSTSVIFKYVKPSLLISIAATCFMVGCIMLAVTPVHQSYFQMTMGVQFVLAWAMDISFPAASILISDFLPLEHQGMGGSLINTSVNYSNAFFLALSLSVEKLIFDSTQSTIQSYRAAMYFAIGVAALGVFCSIVFIYVQRNDKVGDIMEVEEFEDESEEKLEINKFPTSDILEGHKEQVEFHRRLSQSSALANRMM
ncbi:uncharacterized protein KQ657_002333 [Scheffersomyces spartinae]|uniref:Major facilitator superfamily (MFS) profile domain-containing protein n=1 Tax=Scheffersomyces spartinae TaxID=45513 RepID=A0A9P8AKI5_9ASCO|nr:uncharacterized protein KQ657_002333 [Scheffersomyces spartinae]KAG7195947.1 hypothetical protein KQ657_002333 [Scheffersomyces spartinae]